MIDSASVRHLKNICDKYPPLTKEAEDELFEAYRKGSTRAANKIVLHHTRLALKIAHKFARYGASIEDVFSEACLGVAKAVPMFDSTRGVRFVTLARLYVTKQVCEYIENSTAAVSIPETDKVRAIFWNMKRLREVMDREELTSQDGDNVHGRSSGSRLTSDMLRYMNSICTPALSINTSSNPDDDWRAGNVENMFLCLPDQDNAMIREETKKILNKAIQNVLETVSQKHRQIFALRYLSADPPTVSEIAEQFDMSPGGVIKAYQGTLAKIRTEILRSEGGNDYDSHIHVEIPKSSPTSSLGLS